MPVFEVLINFMERFFFSFHVISFFTFLILHAVYNVFPNNIMVPWKLLLINFFQWFYPGGEKGLGLINLDR